jgi:hypothetical protein
VLSVLDYVLERMEARYLAFTPELDRLLLIQTPRKEDVAHLKDHIPAYVVLRRYFFDRLTHWEWLMPLRRAGFFRYPPSLERNEEQRTVGAEPWPESGYLARMACIPEAQTLAVEIALEVPETENTRVYEDLLDVALAVPPAEGAKFVAPTCRWIQQPYKWLLDKKTCDLLLRLIAAGEAPSALELTATLLRPIGRSPGIESYVSDWEFERLVKTALPALGSLAGQETLDLLVSLVERTITLERDVTPPQDLSFLWRPAIEDHDQNHADSIPNLLVQGLRDTAVQFVSADPARLADVVRSLDARAWYLFHRLSLYLLRCFPEPNPGLLSAHLTDQNRFHEPSYRHEFYGLAKHCFVKLDAAAQAVFLGMIAAGRPNTEVGEGESPELVSKRNEYWQLQRLAAIRDHLPPDWAERYQELEAEFGPPEHVDFVSFHSVGWVGPRSPKNFDDLSTLSVPDLRAFLAGWQSPGDPFGPTPEGLGRILADVVARSPERYATDAMSFAGLDPTYVRSLIAGLTSAAKSGVPIVWAPVLELCTWVANKPPDRLQLRRPTEADPDWNWARMETASLLAAGFEAGGGEIPRTLRTEAWAPVELLTRDPDPTSGEEAPREGARYDPLSRAISSTRGKAIEAAFAYLRWIRRHNDAQSDAPNRRERGMEEFPEARDLLSRHLDPGHEPTQAIRSLFGLNFPLLVALDRQWAEAQIEAIFPSAAEQSTFFDASFETFVTFCDVNRLVFRLLASKYELAVGRLSTRPDSAGEVNDPAEHLVQHIMVLYLFGDVTLGSSLMEAFWAHANDVLRAHAIETLGRIAEEEGSAIRPEQLERMRLYWETRMQIALPQAASHAKELAAFGWWSASGRLDQDWVLDHLLTVIKSVRQVQPEHKVLEALARYAQARPAKAVACLAELINPPHTPWLPMSREEFNAILGAALAAEDAAANRTAEEAINRLAALGYIEYRELLTRHS